MKKRARRASHTHIKKAKEDLLPRQTLSDHEEGRRKRERVSYDGKKARGQHLTIRANTLPLHFRPPFFFFSLKRKFQSICPLNQCQSRLFRPAPAFTVCHAQKNNEYIWNKEGRRRRKKKKRSYFPLSANGKLARERRRRRNCRHYACHASSL